MGALAFFADFDSSIKKAVKTVFPQTPIFGDYWHFLHANKLWIRKYIPEIKMEQLNHVIDFLRCVYYSDTVENLTINTENLYKNTANYKGFGVYFKTTWFNTRQDWAFCFRAYGYPSGDNILESWHHNIKSGKNFVFHHGYINYYFYK